MMKLWWIIVMPFFSFDPRGRRHRFCGDKMCLFGVCLSAQDWSEFVSDPSVCLRFLIQQFHIHSWEDGGLLVTVVRWKLQNVNFFRGKSALFLLSYPRRELKVHKLWYVDHGGRFWKSENQNKWNVIISKLFANRMCFIQKYFKF